MKSYRLMILSLALVLSLVALLSLGFNGRVSRAQEELPTPVEEQEFPPEKPAAAPEEPAAEEMGQPAAIEEDIKGGFSYQGILRSNNAPLNATCNFLFRLYDAATAGNKIGSDSAVTGVVVSNGLFTTQVNSGTEFGEDAFRGAPRYLQVAVKCGADASYTTLSPRQLINGTPYALGLRPGLRMYGGAYQNLKIQSNAPAGGIPAAVTGEMMVAKDGVGVYGSNNSTTSGATGAGVWGRSWTPSGAGVVGTSVGGNIGVKGESSFVGVLGEASGTGGVGVGGKAENTSCTAGLTGCYGVDGDSNKGNGVGGFTNSGVALLGYSSGTGYALFLEGQGSGDLIRAIHGPISPDVQFRVTYDGNVYADGTWHSPAADMAEMLPAHDGLEAGDVLVIGVDGKLARCSQAAQSSLAGVYSTKPGFLGGAGDEADLIGEVPLAVVGVAPVKVSAENGAIQPGDLLTTSATPGHAMKASPISVEGVTFYPSGVILGKALEGLAQGTGVIQVLIILQ